MLPSQGQRSGSKWGSHTPALLPTANPSPVTALPWQLERQARARRAGGAARPRSLARAPLAPTDTPERGCGAAAHRRLPGERGRRRGDPAARFSPLAAPAGRLRSAGRAWRCAARAAGAGRGCPGDPAAPPPLAPLLLTSHCGASQQRVGSKPCPFRPISAQSACPQPIGSFSSLNSQSDAYFNNQSAPGRAPNQRRGTGARPLCVVTQRRRRRSRPIVRRVAYRHCDVTAPRGRPHYKIRVPAAGRAQ